MSNSLPFYLALAWVRARTFSFKVVKQVFLGQKHNRKTWCVCVCFLLFLCFFVFCVVMSRDVCVSAFLWLYVRAESKNTCKNDGGASILDPHTLTPRIETLAHSTYKCVNAKPRVYCVNMSRIYYEEHFVGSALFSLLLVFFYFFLFCLFYVKRYDGYFADRCLF